MRQELNINLTEARLLANNLLAVPYESTPSTSFADLDDSEFQTALCQAIRLYENNSALTVHTAHQLAEVSLDTISTIEAQNLNLSATLDNTL